MPDTPEEEIRIPSDPEEIADILAQKLGPIVQALEAIELPEGWANEPSPAFRVAWRQS